MLLFPLIFVLGVFGSSSRNPCSKPNEEWSIDLSITPNGVLSYENSRFGCKIWLYQVLGKDTVVNIRGSKQFINAFEFDSMEENFFLEPQHEYTEIDETFTKHNGGEIMLRFFSSGQGSPITVEWITRNPSPENTLDEKWGFCYPRQDTIIIDHDKPYGRLGSNPRGKTILDPGPILLYAPNSYCEWDLKNPYKIPVHLSIRILLCDDDSVKLTYYDDTETGISISGWEEVSDMQVSILDYDRNLRVRFQSNDQNEGYGFVIEWTFNTGMNEMISSIMQEIEYDMVDASNTTIPIPLFANLSIPNNENPSCYPAQMEIDLGLIPTGFITSNLHGPYAPESHCSWTFNNIPSSVTVQLSGDLNPDDVVEITVGSEIHKYSGFLGDTHSLEIPMIDFFIVHFISSSNQTKKKGFAMTWKCLWFVEADHALQETPQPPNSNLSVGSIVGFVFLCIGLIGMIGFVVVLIKLGKPSPDATGAYEKMEVEAN